MSNVRITNTATQVIRQAGTTHKQRTVSTTALDLLADATDPLTRYVCMQVTGDAIRVTFDGTNPTSTKGFLYPVGTKEYMTPILAKSAKAIRVTGDAVVELQEMNTV